MRNERCVSGAWAWIIGRSENPSNKKRGRPYAEPRFQTVSLFLARGNIGRYYAAANTPKPVPMMQIAKMPKMIQMVLTPFL